MKILILLVLSIHFLTISAFSDETITLKDGTVLEGTIIAWQENRTAFLFKSSQNTKSKTEWIQMRDVEKIQLPPVYTGAKEAKSH
jgi:hypothetical protein